MKILQVNTADLRGGAETMARNLHRVYRQKGHESWLAVGRKYTDDPNVIAIPETDQPRGWVELWRGLGETLFRLNRKVEGLEWFGSAMRKVAEPRHSIPWWQGVEDFHYPGSRHLLELVPDRPGVIHCHNLHGRYFDLNTLPSLSQVTPTVLTLHDAWLLSGHCAHSFECERWRTGCGHCPDLSIYPSIRRDATALNFQRKREIYSKSRLHIATPSHWLMRKVEQSMLAAGMVDARVIPNGVDLSVFHPADKEETRSQLGLPNDVKILLFAANGIRYNIWKDFITMRAAFANLATRVDQERVLFVALGEDAPPERIDGTEIQFVPYETDPRRVALFYQMADVYVHAARADNFPLTVLEALACGVPVVATQVGGISEQIKNNRTGLLVPPGDAESMGSAIETLLLDENLRHELSTEAARSASERFDLNRQAQEYLDWYAEMSESF